MKKFFLPLIFLFFTLQTFSQTEINQKFSKDYYLKKSHIQRTTAWILLGAGGGMMVGGIAIYLGAPWVGPGQNKGLWLFYLGGAVASTSIIFFLNAHHNKKRTTTMAITNQKIPWHQKNSIGFVNQPSFAMRINL